jgi:hypothetical protein
MKNIDSDPKLKREHNETQKRIAEDRALKRQEWNRLHKKKDKKND